MSTFNDLVLLELRRQRRAGARFPSPVGLMFLGKMTDSAKRLGAVELDDVYPLQDRVFSAIKALHAEGRIKYLHLWGYCFLVEPGHEHPEGVVKDVPSGEPWNWNDL